MKTSYFIPQIDHSDCGYAALKMMIAILYENKNALFLKQDENHGPYSFKDLKNKANEYGIHLNGVKIANVKELTGVRVPFIALLKKKNDMFHYVLVTKVKKHSLRYLDPESGECSTSIKNFGGLWMGSALIIDSFEGKEGVIFPERMVEKKRKEFLTPIFQFISAVFLIVGVYYIDDTTKIFIPALFLSLSFISEIILRAYLVKRMEKLDKDMIDNPNVEKGKYYQFYERFEDYKKKSILGNMNIVFSLISILFITSIVLLNNIYNAFIVLIPLFFAIIDTKFIDSSIKEKVEVIASEERELNTLKNVDMLKRQMDKIHLRSYKVARLSMIKKYIIMGLLLITALLTTVFNETFSLPYVIFYFVICFVLFEQYSGFISYPNQKVEVLRSKMRLINLMD